MTNLYPCSVVLEPMGSRPRYKLEQCRGASVASLFKRRLDTQLVTTKPGMRSTFL
jgi:hypothetical protein